MSRLNNEYQQLAANAICHWAEQAGQAAISAEQEKARPSVLFRPKIYMDGNQWCALYGDNLQDGVCGFGDSPELAMWDFDRNWYTKIEAAHGITGEKE